MKDLKLIEYLTKNLNEKDNKLVEEWINYSTKNKTQFYKLKKLWIESNGLEDFNKIDVNANWKSFQDKIDNTSRKNVINRVWKTPLKIAASLIFLISLSLIYKSSFNSTTKLVALNDIENKYILPDNSIVWLNKGSKLTFKNNFEGSQRKVHLNGEAFFEVAKNPNKPFIVQSGITETKVLGTKFNLKESTAKVELFLQEGSVLFSTKTEQKTLIPGNKIISDPSGKLLKIKNTDLNYLSWKTRLLTFEKTPLNIVFEDIEEVYKINITINNDALMKCKLTTEFDHESLENVLETLKILFGIEYLKINDSEYLLKNGSC